MIEQALTIFQASKAWGLLNYFVFLYPLYMSLLWTIGGLVFFFRREQKEPPLPKILPPFSIIIPAHNEEDHIKHVIVQTMNLDYPDYEIIVVDDGSTDKTPEILDKLAEEYKNRLRVIHLTPNSGKAKAQNVAVTLSRHEFILSIDADCYLNPDILKKMAWHFVNFPRVGAVTGNPRVLNRTSLLAKIQIGEFSSIIGLIKRTQRTLGKILTVSGVIAAYRKSALCDVGLFDTDTVTEDIDITWKLQKRFWDIRYESRALAWILVPETFRGLWRQRVRWAQGGAEVLKKHSDIWNDKRQKRLWPIYFEYIITIMWAFALAIIVLVTFFTALIHLFGGVSANLFRAIIPPAWTGSILAFVCLLQFLASLYIDFKYEKKTFVKYYFFVIWYPLFYWLINAASLYKGLYNVHIKKGGISTRWKSPDRGINTRK